MRLPIYSHKPEGREWSAYRQQKDYRRMQMRQTNMELSKSAAKRANQIMKEKYGSDPNGPIGQYLKALSPHNAQVLGKDWAPFEADWNAHPPERKGVGLRINETEAPRLMASAAWPEVHRIGQDAIVEALLLNRKKWLTVMLNDLYSSGDPIYKVKYGSAKRRIGRRKARSFFGRFRRGT